MDRTQTRFPNREISWFLLTPFYPFPVSLLFVLIIQYFSFITMVSLITHKEEVSLSLLSQLLEVLGYSALSTVPLHHVSDGALREDVTGRLRGVGRLMLRWSHEVGSDLWVDGDG